MDRPDWLGSLQEIFPSEGERFEDFLRTHEEEAVSIEGRRVAYSASGRGPGVLLTFAGGWGGIPLIWETILAFEGTARVVAVDASPFGDPDVLSAAANRVLQDVGAEEVALLGQSYSGILAQLFFRRNKERVKGIILINTLAPDPKRCRGWARLLLKGLPFFLLKPLLRRQLRKLGRIEEDIPPEVVEARRFAQAMLAETMDDTFGREQLDRMLSLAWRFNEEGEYGQDELEVWEGRGLLVGSEDDPHREDMSVLKSMLPSAEECLLPAGFGHLAPQILREDWQAAARTFLRDLNRSKGGKEGGI